jgi:hypothetical protein
MMYKGPNRGQKAGSGAVVVSGVAHNAMISRSLSLPSHIMERWVW